ncbi:ATP-dependent RNA helicase [Actinorhabdospora filicis]|uniref:ATP-dependent RNA helicase n=1 Tax=Actinorhabdospora filicis TaxID=1785913 RepID=A0A9W6SN80_9ACTN|nr:DEAD/DEAH box helicase [Actinorhabdospora filicis]GLZ79078.1 ATP-dependent RNA helicase [Actinorhabdospora filicis]
MSSPAERYAAARRRAEHPALAEFSSGLEFGLDDFQIRACRALESGGGVLVCAPTGAGKTVVGEFAVHLARRTGRKCFYTTPIKALSNQKFADLVKVYGEGEVGLLTGDSVINGDAPILVMTTEVLRNMLYAGSSALEGLGYVVMDEVHYLADRFRGAVWEEVIIHLPASVTLVSLSATVSNAEEFADWLVSVRGRTEVVVSEHRPVPLWQHMLVGRRMFDLFGNANAAELREVNPQLMREAREQQRRLGVDHRGRQRRGRPVSRPDVIARLDDENLLPAIVFIFSRAGCDAAVAQCLAAGLHLTNAVERAEITKVVERRTAGMAPDDLHALGYWDWLDGLRRGLAAHHAGLLPVFKEVVEELFSAGLVKAVFATETLALGINMPARCVVLERLVKFNGDAHVDITPGEYTQLTGRAGRRGIDIEGHAVVAWSPDLDPRHVAGLASTRTFPLRSSFRPSYNMAINLVANMGAERARGLLRSSFAQFQTDRAVVGLAEQVRAAERAAAVHDKDITCHLGDFDSYYALMLDISGREKTLARSGKAERRDAVAESLARLKVGDVIHIPGGKRAGLAVVLDTGVPRGGEQRVTVLTENRWAGRITEAVFAEPVEALAHVRVPRHFNHRAPAARRDLAATLRNTGAVAHGPRRTRRQVPVGEDVELTRLRERLRAHPCHQCPERSEHAGWARRRQRLIDDNTRLRRKVDARSGSLTRVFDAVCAVLESRGYLDGGHVTDHGRTLSRLWTETDLLVAECLRAGVWEGLNSAELAAVVSTVLYESRRDGDLPATLPQGAISQAVTATLSVWEGLAAEERGKSLDASREPDLGFVWPMFRWARGEPLAKVLASVNGPDVEMPAGDFVRWTRQTMDLLGQISEAVGPRHSLHKTAREAATALKRGVVAYV